MADGYEPHPAQSYRQSGLQEDDGHYRPDDSWPLAGPFLTRLQTSGRLDKAILRQLQAACGRARSVPARTDLVEIGQFCPDLHILLDGWAGRNKILPNGRRQISALLLAGDICDLDQLYHARPDQAVTALTRCTFASIPRSDLVRLIEDSPALGRAIGSLAARENALLGERICGLGQRAGVHDLAHLVCELLFRLRHVGKADQADLRLPLTQEQLGEVLGLTSVHVNRLLQQLRAAGLMEKRRDRIIIPDLDALASFASFSPDYCHFEDAIPFDGSGQSRHSGQPAAFPPAQPTAGASEEHARQVHVLPKALTPFDDREELRHRFKNMVGITQALVSQTLREGVPMAQARRLLSERLAAMAGAVDLLAKADWQEASLKDAIGAALSLSGAANNRIRCNGPELRLGTQAVMSLTLALHELQTNAIKYGALSTPAGVVELSWKTIPDGEGARFWMRWSERHGPVVRKPQKSGFGTRLVTDVTAGALAGEVALDFSPAGMTWTLSAPIQSMAR